ncbi:MAG: 1-acyl-sn-glycerol-3-phosphate acyltransferase [Candidatus Aminicenantes bacterium]|nr:1-acyl-sn-glycerol-3-phosphate acyltransferase [Candidatus Aminicenantes bacterium]MCK5004341.1 1-acyl-sn-glycerol-3-phosphate acyltransferase [Candidatus Aminicenantes bacterium]
MEKYDPWIKSLMRFMLRVIGIKVKVMGVENINPNKTYLFMANHISLFDIPLLSGYVPQLVRGIEADRQFKWPLYGFAIKRLGNIPINRKNVHSAIKSVGNAIQRLKEKRSIIVLPEGHRTLDGNLNPFKKLPFHLAKRSDSAIIPMGLSGLFSLKRKGSWIIMPGPVQINFGKPIPVEIIRSKSVEELRDYTKNVISGLIDFH